MNLDEEDEILDAIRKRREANEIRGEVIAYLKLKGKAERNVHLAVVYFLVAFGVWLTQFLMRRALFETSGLQTSIGTEMILALTSIILVWNGYRCLVPDPCDRFLLLLAKEALLKGDEPSRAQPKDSEGQSSA